MKRFNLTEQVKGLINGYSDEVGIRYFILSMVNEFNPRCDDSWFQALFLEYNPTLYNGNEEYIDTLSNAGRELTEMVIEQFQVYFGDSCNINQVGNGITLVTSDKAGIALTFADSDLGLYITYMETLC
jgi:hypothetical protein